MEFLVALILFGQVAVDSEDPPASGTVFGQQANPEVTENSVEPETVTENPMLPPLESFPRRSAGGAVGASGTFGASGRNGSASSFGSASSMGTAGSAGPAGTIGDESDEARFAPSLRNPRSSDVIQAAATSPARSAASEPPAISSEASRYAGELLTHLLTPDEKQQSTLRKVKLIDVIGRVSEGQQQANAIGAYWNLAMAIARLRYAQDKLQTVQAVPQPSVPADRSLLESVQAISSANEAAARDDLLSAQFRLMRATGMAWEGTLPWPADVPLVGPYRTNFESFFAQRTAPIEVRHIHMSLPGKLRWIERCVHAIGAAEASADATLEAYKAGRAPVAQVIESLDRLEISQHAFLASVVDYNGRIAEYSIAAVGPAIGPDTLVSTLIRTSSSSANLVSVPQDVRSAPGQTPAAAANPGAMRR